VAQPALISNSVDAMQGKPLRSCLFTRFHLFSRWPTPRVRPCRKPQRGTSGAGGSRLPGRAGGDPPGPPQTRTCAIHAYGSSGRATAALFQSSGLPWSGLVSLMSLPCVRPADALPDGAFPPMGPLGLSSPRSPVLDAATTATLSLSGRFAGRSPSQVPCQLPAFV
jgi:hypothetical protein